MIGQQWHKDEVGYNENDGISIAPGETYYFNGGFPPITFPHMLVGFIMTLWETGIRDYQTDTTDYHKAFLVMSCRWIGGSGISLAHVINISEYTCNQFSVYTYRIGY